MLESHERRGPVRLLLLFLLLTRAALAQGSPFHFERVATHGVSGTAEIVDVTSDGDTLLYTDAVGQTLGFVDITDPAHPVTLGTMAMPGQPTSVSVAGDWALVAVWVDLPSEGSPPPAFAPGALVVVDVSDPANPVIVGSVPIGWHPDSVKATFIAGQLVGVVAIENEPLIVENGLVAEGDAPGDPNDASPPGLIQVVVVNTAAPALSSVVSVSLPAGLLAAAGLYYPADPQPEFVAIHGTTAAVSLQENNGIAIVDFADPAAPSLVNVFPLGIAGDRAADLVEDEEISFAGTYPGDVGITVSLPTDGGGNPLPGGLRFPDAVAFSPDGATIFSADEGELDFTGGRGFSAWTPAGALAFEELTLERRAVLRGHYPEGRSANKGIEVEGVAVATFGNHPVAFFLSERGSFMAIYRLTSGGPEFLQLIATGISPEGIVAIPARDLVVTAEEVSATLTIYARQPGPWHPPVDEPILRAVQLAEPFSALSGLCAAGPSHLFAVPDDAAPTKVFRIHTGGGFAPVQEFRTVTRLGIQARYDGEGICRDTSIVAPMPAGWWIASEGDASSIPNLLVQVARTGEVLREIQLPVAIDPAADPALPGAAVGPAGGQLIRSNGFEGVTLSADGRYLVACIQREFAGEFSGAPKLARIARYDLAQIGDPALSAGLRTGGDWELFYYPLDPVPAGFAGVSEITAIGPDHYAVIERDNQIGLASVLKKVYAFTLAPVVPDADGVPGGGDTVTKVELFDVLDEFFPFEKIEGLAFTAAQELWIGLDNDGGEVESRLLNLGAFTSPLSAPAYPNGGDDLALTVSIDGIPVPAGIAAVLPGNALVIHLVSPGGALAGGTVLIAAQPFPTGQVPGSPGFPGLYLDFLAPVPPVLLVDGAGSPLGPLGLGPAGMSLGPTLLAGLPAGTSVMLQGAVLSSLAPNGSFALSNGAELRGY